MSVSDREAAARAARAQQIGLFRYALIRPATDPELTTRQRGALVRSLAEQTHAGPGGEPMRVSRKTIDRWIRAWRSGGFDALVPAPRQVAPRTDATVLELAVGLKKENPHRTATQVARILRVQLDWSPSERTLQRLFARHQLNRRPGRPAAGAFGRFEAGHINEIWTTDVMHGPKINGHKSYLFAIIDDHSRLIVGAKFCYREDTIRLAGVLHTALQSRGVLATCAQTTTAALLWTAGCCGRARSSASNSPTAKPGRPEGRGKIERWFATVRQQFLVELTTGDEQNKPGQKTKTAAHPSPPPTRYPAVAAMRSSKSSVDQVRTNLTKKSGKNVPHAQGKWQAASWPGRCVTKGGVTVAQMSSAFQHLVRKTQPEGGAARLGNSPVRTIVS